MARFTLPRDLYHGRGAIDALKTFKGKKAIICTGGASMKRFGLLERGESFATNAIGDACTASNPHQPSQEEMVRLLKCCYYDTEVDF